MWSISSQKRIKIKFCDIIKFYWNHLKQNKYFHLTKSFLTNKSCKHDSLEHNKIQRFQLKFKSKLLGYKLNSTTEKIRNIQ